MIYIVTIDGIDCHRHADQLRKIHSTEWPTIDEFHHNDDDSEEPKSTGTAPCEPRQRSADAIKLAQLQSPVYTVALPASAETQVQSTSIMSPAVIQSLQQKTSAMMSTKTAAAEANTRRSQRGDIPRCPLPYDKNLKNSEAQ